MPAWPGTLPQTPDVEGYEETTPNNLIRSNMDAGPAKVRRRFTSGVREHSMQMVLTNTETAALDTFFITDCASGSLSFTWVRPRDSAAKSFRFLERPKYVALGNSHWRAIFRLEELP